MGLLDRMISVTLSELTDMVQEVKDANERADTANGKLYDAEYSIRRAAQRAEWLQSEIDTVIRTNDGLLNTVNELRKELRLARMESGALYVQLESIGANKINVIKAVREITGIGLKDSKDLVESAPCIIVENVSEAAANAIVVQLRNAGATVSVLIKDSADASDELVNTPEQ